MKDILQLTFDGGDLKPADIICKDGKLAPQVQRRLGLSGLSIVATARTLP